MTTLSSVVPARLDTVPVPDTRLIPRHVLFGNPANLDPAISPDGRRVAWLAPHDDVLNVWVSDLPAAPNGGRVVTLESDRGIRHFTWSPDGTRIIYLSDSGGDENWCLRDVDLSTGVRRLLTPAGAQARILKLSRRKPGQLLVAINLDNPEKHDVYRLDLATAELTKVCANPGFISLVADENLAVRAALAPLPDGGVAILIRADDGQQWRPLLRVGQADAISTRPIAFDRNGNRLLCITSADSDTARLVWIDTTTADRQVVLGDPVYDVSDVLLHPETNEPRIAYIQRERLFPVVLDPTVAAAVARLATIDGGDLRVLGVDDADATWLVATGHDDGPIRYYAYHRDTAKERFLFAHQPDLYGYPLARMEPFTIRSRDGLGLHGYVTFPPDVDRHDLPAVFVVHGGPWARDTWRFHPVVQWLANRGYVAVQVNFRGSTGYGKRFLSAGDREWGAKMHDDLLDALDWTVQQGWVDPDRVGIYGVSYGGYAALAAAAFTPDTFRCAVSLAGPANLATLLAAMPPYWAPIITQAYNRIGNPNTEADFLWSRSPLSKVDQIRVPLLIAQGANDPRVPTSESEQIVAALRKIGIDHTYLLFPDEGHTIDKPHNRLRFYAQAELFLAQHLGRR